MNNCRVSGDKKTLKKLGVKGLPLDQLPAAPPHQKEKPHAEVWYFTLHFIQAFYVGPFKSKETAEKFRQKHYPIGLTRIPTTVDDWNRERTLAALTKDVRLPKKVKGYALTDHSGEVYAQGCNSDGFPTIFVNKKKVLELDNAVAFYATKEEAMAQRDRRRDYSIGTIEGDEHHEPTPFPFLQTDIDPACRVFEVEAEVADLSSAQCGFSSKRVRVLAEHGKKDADALYKRFKKVYDMRDALREHRLRVTPGMKEVAKQFLEKPTANQIRRLLALARGELPWHYYDGRGYGYHDTRFTKGDHEIANDPVFFEWMKKLIPLTQEKELQTAYYKAMILVSYKFREELIKQM